MESVTPETGTHYCLILAPESIKACSNIPTKDNTAIIVKAEKFRERVPCAERDETVNDLI